MAGSSKRLKKPIYFTDDMLEPLMNANDDLAKCKVKANGQGQELDAGVKLFYLAKAEDLLKEAENQLNNWMASRLEKKDKFNMRIELANAYIRLANAYY